MAFCLRAQQIDTATDWVKIAGNNEHGKRLAAVWRLLPLRYLSPALARTEQVDGVGRVPGTRSPVRSASVG